MNRAKKSSKKKDPSAKGSRSIHAQISGETILVRKQEMLVRKSSDNSVSILDLNNEKNFFTIDAIAAQFWLAIDGKKTVGEIKKGLLKKFDPPTELFNKEVSKLIHDLKKNGLVDEL